MNNIEHALAAFRKGIKSYRQKITELDNEADAFLRQANEIKIKKTNRHRPKK